MMRKVRLFRRLAKIRSGVEVAVRVRPMNQRETLQQTAAETADDVEPRPCVLVRPGKVFRTQTVT